MCTSYYSSQESCSEYSDTHSITLNYTNTHPGCIYLESSLCYWGRDIAFGIVSSLLYMHKDNTSNMFEVWCGIRRFVMTVSKHLVHRCVYCVISSVSILLSSKPLMRVFILFQCALYLPYNMDHVDGTKWTWLTLGPVYDPGPHFLLI